MTNNIDYAEMLAELEKNHSYDDPIPQDIGFLRYLLNSNSRILDEDPHYTFYNFTSKEVMEDPALVKILINKFPNELPLQSASEEIKNNKEIVKLAIESSNYSFKFASEELRNDKEIALLAMGKGHNAIVLEYIGEILKKDKEFFNEISKIAVNNDPRAIQFACEDIKHDENICISVIKKDGLQLKHISPQFKDNKENVLIAINSNSAALEFASERLKDDAEIVLAAIDKDGVAIKHASNRLKTDKQLALIALNNTKFYTNRVLEELSDSLKNDKEVILTAMNIDPGCFSFASTDLRSDKELVIEAIKLYPPNLKYADDIFKNDKEIVLLALSNTDKDRTAVYAYSVLEYVSSQFQNDKEIVKLAIKNNKSALEHASTDLRNDKEFILEILKEYPDSKYYIGTKLKEEIGDQDIIKYLETYLFHERMCSKVENKNIKIDSKKKI